jgi:hypothetical protein
MQYECSDVSCEILNSGIECIEQRYGKSIDKEIAMGAQNGSTSIISFDS